MSSTFVESSALFALTFWCFHGRHPTFWYAKHELFLMSLLHCTEPSCFLFFSVLHFYFHRCHCTPSLISKGIHIALRPSQSKWHCHSKVPHELHFRKNRCCLSILQHDCYISILQQIYPAFLLLHC